jgi:hypothetical protein
VCDLPCVAERYPHCTGSRRRSHPWERGPASP